MTTLIIGLIWLVIGALSFIYWWTKDHDFTLGIEIVAALIAAFMGPLSFPIGWMIHGDSKTIIIFKKRKNGIF